MIQSLKMVFFIEDLGTSMNTFRGLVQELHISCIIVSVAEMGVSFIMHADAAFHFQQVRFVSRVCHLKLVQLCVADEGT